ncbi:MAG TPA: succinate dehydrogenase, cytochrome b556 subunit [Alphaproteobacteria bacterium]|jgi:succinate dehydrogenase / fumarate reductase cytochrome b subunit|nr:succinate dehydrogenase, cytochrome b556 subunit [Alphaproteobacteria bacterium]HMS44800.1 succinate dehydrogenase, cytochrome b556 subunit [Alphaproteobacteria bacterium]
MKRPISPHLQIYRWQLTSVMSILHRMTGVSLVFGTLLLSYWLLSAAFGASAFQTAHDLLTSWIGYLLLIGWSLAFYYHLANGIRHLFWDMGRGFELRHVYRSGWVVVFTTILLTVLTWVVVFLC